MHRTLSCDRRLPYPPLLHDMASHLSVVPPSRVFAIIRTWIAHYDYIVRQVYKVKFDIKLFILEASLIPADNPPRKVRHRSVWKWADD